MTILLKKCSKHVAMPLAVGLLMLPGVLLAQSADSESVARDNWRSTMKHMAVPHKGCFHATFPDLVWESVACEQESPNAQPMHVPPKGDSTKGDAATVDSAQGGTSETAGDGYDYVASTGGLINIADAYFLSASVPSEASFGVAAFGNGGILGANEYSLQINTNANDTTAACQGHSGCRVWQQFVYATDYSGKGKADVFIQYWLLGYGSSCPSGWHAYEGSCWKNGNLVSAPDVPATKLGVEGLYASVTPGGTDWVEYWSGTEGYVATGEDSVLDIATVWHQAEFNVFGDGGGSEAVFSDDTSINVLLLVSASGVPVTCLGPTYAGTTGESNDLILGSCTTVNGIFERLNDAYDSYIEFPESLIYQIP